MVLVLWDGLKLGLILLVDARATSAVITTATSRMAFDCGLQMLALEHLLTTVALGVSSARLAGLPTMLAL
jgi:hypothetical protein